MTSGSLTKVTCTTCMWWQESDERVSLYGLLGLEGEVGQCRRATPVGTVQFDDWTRYSIGGRKDSLRGLWHTTNASDWCGEHRPKEPS